MTNHKGRLRAARADELDGYCVHGLRVCSRCAIVEDAGRRMAELVNLRVSSTPWDLLVNSWMAFRMDDGSSDNVLYDTRESAMKHQPDERYCFYLCMRNAMGGVQPLDAQLLINMQRQVYSAGGRLADPDAPSIIVSSKGYDKLTGRIDPSA